MPKEGKNESEIMSTLIDADLQVSGSMKIIDKNFPADKMTDKEREEAIKFAERFAIVYELAPWKNDEMWNKFCDTFGSRLK